MKIVEDSDAVADWLKGRTWPSSAKTLSEFLAEAHQVTGSPESKKWLEAQTRMRYWAAAPTAIRRQAFAYLEGAHGLES